MDSKFGDGSSLPYFNPYKTCGNGGLSRAFKRHIFKDYRGFLKIRTPHNKKARLFGKYQSKKI